MLHLQKPGAAVIVATTITITTTADPAAGTS
jgi:hypothetical protein